MCYSVITLCVVFGVMVLCQFKLLFRSSIRVPIVDSSDSSV